MPHPLFENEIVIHAVKTKTEIFRGTDPDVASIAMQGHAMSDPVVGPLIAAAHAAGATTANIDTRGLFTISIVKAGTKF